MFTAALFTIVKTWKKPKYIYVCVYTHTHTHTIEYSSAIKKDTKENLPILITWMDLVGIMLREISQRKTNYICSH